MSPAEPDVLAGKLAEAAGLAPVESIDRLTGGKNNRVFGVTLSDGRRVVMKSYHHDERDTRDRLGAEWSFLRYVWDRGVRNVPEPLASIPSEHAGLYGFIPGARAAEITDALVDAAADFVAAINAAPREPHVLNPGSEACFSIADHVATVARRVARLATLDDTAPHVDDARTFVRKLEASWQRVEARIIAETTANGVALDTSVTQQIVSPSDFGFHNALVDEGCVGFIDFEYAGRDDPAKLVCDFFCQPEVPVPLDHYPRFRDSVIGALNLTRQDAWRCDLLLDAYRIKWVCIILNEFLPLGASRRAFAEAFGPRSKSHTPARPRRTPDFPRHDLIRSFATMAYKEFVTTGHKSTQRDYLARVTQRDKAEVADLAIKFDYDYWDGSRETGYGGYKYDGRWRRVADAMVATYGIKPGMRILDVGSGKGFLLHDFLEAVPGVEVHGLEYSQYAIDHSMESLKGKVVHGTAAKLPFPDKHFDLVISINTLHNLYNYDLDSAFREIERVAKGGKYICVETYRNEREKMNLMYWQLTCRAFCTPDEWAWWFKQTGYTGDHEFIWFE